MKKKFKRSEIVLVAIVAIILIALFCAVPVFGVSFVVVTAIVFALAKAIKGTSSDAKIEQPYKEREFYSFNLAGVTFPNEDGTSRQELLRKIKENLFPFDGVVNYKLKTYKFNDEMAVAVYADDLNQKYQIGVVPREHLPIILKNWNNDIHIFDVEIHGGQITESGEQLSYGASVTVEYTTTSKPEPAAVKNQKKQIYVYVTKNGKRYHYDQKCAGKGAAFVPLEKARARGLSECQKCK